MYILVLVLLGRSQDFFFLTAYRAEYKKVGSTFASLSTAFAIDEDSESKESLSHIYLQMNSALLTCRRDFMEPFCPFQVKSVLKCKKCRGRFIYGDVGLKCRTSINEKLIG